MNLSRLLVIIFVLVIPSMVLADTGKFCSYLIDFGLNNKDFVSTEEAYSLQNCVKGDVISIFITDSDKLGREAMYLAGEIAEICDNTLPVTIINSGRAICTYRGSRRSIRQPKK